MEIQKLEWKYTKPISGASQIHQIAEKIGLEPPKEYVSLAEKNNGGRPSKKRIDTGSETLQLKSFLRVDNVDEFNTVLNVYNTIKTIDSRLLPFADDSFGNFFCLFFHDKNATPSVVFLDKENETFAEISQSFVSFINKLY